ncbi:MAG TPA: cytidine deaminase [Candidatus Blautia faecavium]|uniref:Cytidine deaminase n=1 Tax=Candidatus Blautia faecavium TaxID=2838487 RepID=A0A9D2LSW0_9FIRM|nr:cytidine deaminase [Candidatus Blautia faecavium]
MSKLTVELKKELIKKAFSAQKRAYTPYSGFQVGAALLTRDGKIYEGCNIENASYGATNCAERTAFFRAVYEGERDFLAIAIVGKPEKSEEYEYCAPCGICRQVMAEFGVPEEFQIILPRSLEDYKEFTLEELLPLSFTGDSMKSKTPQ